MVKLRPPTRRHSCPEAKEGAEPQSLAERQGVEPQSSGVDRLKLDQVMSCSLWGGKKEAGPEGGVAVSFWSSYSSS